LEACRHKSLFPGQFKKNNFDLKTKSRAELINTNPRVLTRVINRNQFLSIELKLLFLLIEKFAIIGARAGHIINQNLWWYMSAASWFANEIIAVRLLSAARQVI
jgi:hypothetical protein